MLKTIVGLTGASVFGQLIAMLLLMAIARLYSPEEFGQYGFLVSLAGLLACILPLRFDMLCLHLSKKITFIVLPQLIATMLVIGLLISLFLSNIYEIHYLYLLLLTVGTFLFNLGNVLLSKYNSFKNLSAMRFSKPVLTSSSQLILGLTGINNGLLIGGVFGAILSSLFFWENTKKISSQFFRRYIILIRLLSIKIKNIKSLLFQSLFNNLFINSCVIYFFVTGEYELAGILAMLERVVKNPISIIGSAIRSITISKLGSSCHKESFKKLGLMNLCIGIIIFFSCAICYESKLLLLILGEEWRIKQMDFYLYLSFSVFSILNSVNSPFIVKFNLTSIVARYDFIAVCVLFLFSFYEINFLMLFVILYLIYCAINFLLVSRHIYKVKYDY